jgi:nucleotide-binding universal stress UspA family protein
MEFRKILVPVIGAKQDHVALAAAFAAAKPFDAHVEALFVHPDPREAVPYVGMPVSPEVIQQIVDSAEHIARNAATAAHAALEKAASQAGVKLVEHPVTGEGFVTACFREVNGHFITRVGEAARLSDLVVFGPATLDSGPDVSGAFVETLTHAERPVLLAAEGALHSLTRKIVIGYDRSVAASHAISAALPLLAHAHEVELIAVQETPLDTQSLDEAVEYLALHGVSATSHIISKGERSAGEALLEAAAKDGASMLVIGGYGHSRMLESIFGGTTLHLTRHRTVPLFMVH